MRRLLALAATVALAGSVAACGDDSDPETVTGGLISMEASDFRFDPPTVDTPAGQPVTIELRNAGDARHNLTIEGLGVDIDVESGASNKAEVTPEAGTYDYRCEYHPAQMTGTLTVT